MAKKNDKVAKAAKRQRGMEKALKNQKKSDVKSKKLDAKIGAKDEDTMDIDEILAEMANKQEEFEKVSIEVCHRPSKRQNGTLIANPSNRRELLLFGGEMMNKEGSAFFYNDLFVYNTHTDVWRSIKSANSPLPRSSHAMCAHPSGIVVMHGGEFSSPKQTTFHHYGDTWILDGDSKEWTKIEPRGGQPAPQARSGHRMCVWKNYILLHGGFRDLSQNTSYLGDLWAFDISDYKWHKIEIPQTLLVPEPRSGHSLLPTPEGAVLYGGYTKVKASSGQQKGKVLKDSWVLHMKSDLKDIKWERRKKGSFAPSPRIGCQLVPHRLGTGRGILFGGVYDTEETEESLVSTFYNAIYSYQAKTNRWNSLRIRTGRKCPPTAPQSRQTGSLTIDDLERNLSQILKNLNIDVNEMLESDDDEAEKKDTEEEDEKASSKVYPIISTLPHVRYNATTCVSGDTLYILNGTWEDGDREIGFDSFYSVDISKLDGVKVFWEELSLEEARGDSDDEEEGDDDGDDDEDESMKDSVLISDEEEEEEEEDEQEEGGEKDPRPWLPHPKPFEVVGAFYKKHVNAFVEWALKQEPDSRGKDLRTHAFELCRSRWWERREVAQATEDQFEELGGVDEVVERNVRSGRR